MENSCFNELPFNESIESVKIDEMLVDSNNPQSQRHNRKDKKKLIKEIVNSHPHYPVSEIPKLPKIAIGAGGIMLKEFPDILDDKLNCYSLNKEEIDLFGLDERDHNPGVEDHSDNVLAAGFTIAMNEKEVTPELETAVLYEGPDKEKTHIPYDLTAEQNTKLQEMMRDHNHIITSADQIQFGRAKTDKAFRIIPQRL